MSKLLFISSISWLGDTMLSK